MRARHSSEHCDSTDRKRDALNPGKCCWAPRKKSAHAQTCTFLSDASPSCLYFLLCLCLQVLASQVMEEVLPYLQRQLHSKVKGKKSERIRQWIAVSLSQLSYLVVITMSLFFCPCPPHIIRHVITHVNALVCSLCELSDSMTGAQCDSFIFTRVTLKRVK